MLPTLSFLGDFTEVKCFTVEPGRPLHQAKIEQQLRNYGAPCKYSDLQPSTWTVP